LAGNAVLSFFKSALSALQCAFDFTTKPAAMEGKLGTALLIFAVMLVVITAYPYPLAAGPASESTGITSGAIITQRNWQLYRQFMSEGLVALFEGKQFWHLPADLQIEVGPTISIPLPKKYLNDTVRYSNRVKLIRTSSGGYVPVGYVAGLPFPHLENTAKGLPETPRIQQREVLRRLRCSARPALSNLALFADKELTNARTHLVKSESAEA